jgi:GNAT superfamily N-acetyltransferase
LVLRLADLAQPSDQQAVLRLIDAYARDPLGQGAPLATEVAARLVDGLRSHPGTLIVLATRAHEAIGIAVCFRGFSTFAARPLINVHDLAVLPEHRGRGVGRALLEEVARHARQAGCCRLTLEVQHGNASARGLYESVGFQQDKADDAAGGTLFYSYPLA